MRELSKITRKCGLLSAEFSLYRQIVGGCGLGGVCTLLPSYTYEPGKHIIRNSVYQGRHYFLLPIEGLNRTMYMYTRDITKDVLLTKIIISLCNIFGNGFVAGGAGASPTLVHFFRYLSYILPAAHNSM